MLSLLLYYCCTTALPLLYYCCTAAVHLRAGMRSQTSAAVPNLLLIQYLIYYTHTHRLAIADVHVSAPFRMIRAAGVVN